MVVGIDDAAITLASIDLFLEIFDQCDKFYQGCKKAARFSRDFDRVTVRMSTQWFIFCSLVKEKKLIPDRMEDYYGTHRARIVVEKNLKLLRDYFSEAQVIITQYTSSGKPEQTTSSSPLHLLPGTSGSGAASPTSVSISASTLVGTEDAKGRRRVKWDGWRKIHRKLSKIWSKKGEDTTSMVERSSQSSDPGPIHCQDPETTDKPAFQEEHIRGVGPLALIDWVRHGQETLDRLISDITQTINDMKSVLEFLSPAADSPVVQAYDKEHKRWSLLDKVRFFLHNLHKDLLAINPSPDPPGYHLSLRLVADQETARKKLLARRYTLQERLRHASMVFEVECQSNEASAEEGPRLLILETRCGQKRSDDTTRQLKNLHQPNEAPLMDNLEFWGRVVPNHVDLDDHFVYHAKDDRRRQVETLSSLLGQPEYQTRVQPKERAELAQLVLSSHLCLEGVREDCPMPRAENYVFYHAPEKTDVWVEGQLLVLSPWLHFGFGERKPPSQIAEDSGIADTGDGALVELGLLLYQIGSGKLLDYGRSPDDLTKTKLAVVSLLEAPNDLDRHAGPGYTTIVQSLLSVKSKGPYMQDREDMEPELVKSAISQLQDLIVNLQQTRALPLRVVGATYAVPAASETQRESVKSDVAGLSPSTQRSVPIRLQAADEQDATAGAEQTEQRAA